MSLCDKSLLLKFLVSAFYLRLLLLAGRGKVIEGWDAGIDGNNYGTCF